MVTLPKRYKFVLLPAVLVTTAVLYVVMQYHYQIQNALSYATRPLWDSPEGPKEVIPHYYAEGMKMDGSTCKLHHWPARPANERIRVFDAVLMSSELDLLEIRLHELDPIVDLFFIVESNATFTGLPKETYFASNRARYSKFDSKIVYKLLPGLPLKQGETAWDVEARHRVTMTSLLQDHIQKSPSGTKHLVIMSDVDEIPARHAISLLKTCNFGSSIHLQLRNYLYSYEWYIGPSSWRASVHDWQQGTYYRHSQSGDRILADSGWHCSYCFRTLPEYVVKMKGFSHSDRIGGRQELLDLKRIQQTICTGKDMFGMLPEAYSYLDMFSQLSLQPLSSAVGLPLHLLEHADRFRFLLPGGCRRDD